LAPKGDFVVQNNTRKDLFDDPTFKFNSGLFSSFSPAQIRNETKCNDV